MKNNGLKIKETFQGVAGLIKYIVVFVVIAGLLSVLFSGVRFLSGVLIPVLTAVSFVMFMAMFFMIILSSFVKKYRGITSIALLIFSYFFGVTAWFLGLSSTLYYFGFLWVIIGVFMLGVGVIPIGLLALAVNGQGWNFITLVSLLVLAFQARKWALQFGMSYGKNSPRARTARGRAIDLDPEEDYSKPRQASYRVIESTISEEDRPTSSKKTNKSSKKKA